jgi:hypothetical protein
MDSLKTIRHYYKNTVIIRSFIYCIYQQLRANFESYLTLKGSKTIFMPFLKFRQAIAKAIFIKNS